MSKKIELPIKCDENRLVRVLTEVGLLHPKVADDRERIQRATQKLIEIVSTSDKAINGPMYP
jgi:hypothetical protein